MTDYDKLYQTDIYNWTILSDTCYTIYCHKTFKNSTAYFPSFSFYTDSNELNLDGTLISCDSFDKANRLVSGVLRANHWKPAERYLGRYFKLKKLIIKTK